MNYPLDPYWMVALKALLVVVGLLTAFAFMTLIERRLLARFQVRLGPNRVGPFGLLQPLADAIKRIFKEDIVVARADKLLFVLAPLISAIWKRAHLMELYSVWYPPTSSCSASGRSKGVRAASAMLAMR